MKRNDKKWEEMKEGKKINMFKKKRRKIQTMECQKQKKRQIGKKFKNSEGIRSSNSVFVEAGDVVEREDERDGRVEAWALK